MQVFSWDIVHGLTTQTQTLSCMFRQGTGFKTQPDTDKVAVLKIDVLADPVVTMIQTMIELIISLFESPSQTRHPKRPFPL